MPASTTPHTDPTAPHPAIAQTQLWLRNAVIGLGLCPFANAVYVQNKIRYVVFEAQDKKQAEMQDDLNTESALQAALMQRLIDELHFLNQCSANEVDTTLIIAPQLFAAFEDFNDFLGEAEDELWVQGFDGVFQMASFHPQYQFADTAVDDAQNNSNRAPYPTLHILREASVDAAIEAFGDTQSIYERNIATLQTMGQAGYERLLKS